MKKDLKIAFIGESKVGKTCLLNRYLYLTFSDEYNPTPSGDLQEKAIGDSGTTYYLHILEIADIKDIAKTLLESNFQSGIDVAFVVFSVDNVNSSECVDDIVDIINETQHGRCDVILVANKTDLDLHYVSSKSMMAKAQARGLQYIETSAKNGNNVDAMFKLALRSKKKMENSADLDERDAVERESSKRCTIF